MQVILLENVQNLGVLGDSVRVRAGYARNFLVPRGKAVPATPANLAEFEGRRAELERQQAEVIAAAQARADAIEGTSIVVRHKAGEGGKLFGSVGAAEIASALEAGGHVVTRANIRMPGEPIRDLGDYAITVHVDAGVEAGIVLTVEGEGGERAVIPDEDEEDELEAEAAPADAGTDDADTDADVDRIDDD